MLTIALRAARKASELIVRASEELEFIRVDEKGKNDFVTEVDRRAEQEIIYHLKKAYPDHAILGEESGETEGAQPANGSDASEYQWIVDPLDGTLNFIRGIPHYAISIACLYRGKVEHAVVLDPIRGEEFTASRGRGASLNGRRIRVTNARTLDGTLLATGIPFKGRDEKHIPGYTKGLAQLTAQTTGIRRAGAASLDLAYVAAGRVDGFWELGLASWDIAAGSLLVQEAGGLVTDLNGGATYLDSGNIVAATPKLLKPIIQNVRPHLDLR